MRKKNEVNESKRIGLIIKQLRAEIGLTQSELAESIDVSYQQIQKYENGQTAVNIPRLKTLAKALKVPFTTFFELDLLDKSSDEKVKYNVLNSDILPLSKNEVTLIKLFRRVDNKNLKDGLVKLIKGANNV